MRGKPCECADQKPKIIYTHKRNYPFGKKSKPVYHRRKSKIIICKQCNGIIQNWQKIKEGYA